MNSSRHSYVIIARRPNGSAIYSTNWMIAKYGFAKLRELARQQIRAEAS